ncbi:hypothetical protein HK099_000903 [Clydaea vesicula]|uniref:RRM domain-containing protein n=1 Tax=Clydaea vesicula TaxID=447962 RepID=A0AAD5TW60_9FUNG|nr:hypothetical protein HK099_000903 [Clydaea vesicula]
MNKFIQSFSNKSAFTTFKRNFQTSLNLLENKILILKFQPPALRTDLEFILKTYNPIKFVYPHGMNRRTKFVFVELSEDNSFKAIDEIHLKKRFNGVLLQLQYSNKEHRIAELVLINVSYKVTKEELAKYFDKKKYGVLSIRLLTKKNKRNHEVGTAFVKLNSDFVDDFIMDYNNAVLKCMKIAVLSNEDFNKELHRQRVLRFTSNRLSDKVKHIREMMNLVKEQQNASFAEIKKKNEMENACFELGTADIVLESPEKYPVKENILDKKDIDEKEIFLKGEEDEVAKVASKSWKGSGNHWKDYY